MLFNSPEFIFLFLPVTLIVWFLLGHGGRTRAATPWLVLASLFFYGWWDPRYLVLIGFSMGFNFLLGKRLGASGGGGRGLLWLGLAVNLGLLGYFKYTNFLVDNFNAALGAQWQVAKIVLPLGISFFTFQQIGFLVDASRGITREYRFADYCLFVIFFPQLIAGPIVHHKDVLPQFKEPRIFRFNAAAFSAGLTWFTIGWFKKAVLADGIAPFATPVFSAVAEGATPGFWPAWGAALAYTCQIYYDFSGYSDMAVGLGQMFGIRLPVNFNSPYRAANIIDFWRRWHITLSTFLRDYLYIPLGGNRLGPARRYVNVFVTMVLGGIWHGAGWTFVIWGALHGACLLLNHAWQDWRRARDPQPTAAGKAAARALTFLAVLVGWVFFRADGLPAAWRMLCSMGDLAGVAFAPGDALGSVRQIAWTVALLCWAWFAPNTQQWMARCECAPPMRPDPVTPRLARWLWRPNALWAGVTALVFITALLHLSRITEFLYFQF
jgi:D-alanyl-lipoteichoic acid acyltransferase DltB (MBOAT superfamily)